MLAAGLDQDDQPCTTWVYNNAAIQALDIVLQEALGGDVADYAEQRLFGPLMHQTRLTHDDAGNTRLNVGLQSSCGDLPRFGDLFLRGGAWRGEQVVPRRWVEGATGESSQRLNDAYGLLWWLNRPGTVLGDGGAAPDDPAADDPGSARPATEDRAESSAEPGDQMAPGDPAVGGGVYTVSLGAGVLDALVSPSGLAVTGSAGKNCSTDGSSTVTSRAVPKVASVLKNRHRIAVAQHEGGHDLARGVRRRRRARHPRVAEQLVVQLGQAGVAERLGLAPDPVDQPGGVLGEVHDPGRQPVGVHEHPQGVERRLEQVGRHALGAAGAGDVPGRPVRPHLGRRHPSPDPALRVAARGHRRRRRGRRHRHRRRGRRRPADPHRRVLRPGCTPWSSDVHMFAKVDL